MTSGRVVVVAGVAVVAALAADFYYVQERDFPYVAEDGLDAVAIGGARLSVVDYRGLAATSARPQGLRGCFRFADADAALTAARAADAAEAPTPFAAPERLACWDAAQLDADIRAGRAMAVLAEQTRFAEAENALQTALVFERIVVVYPDGRGFQWRRQRGN